VRVLDWMLACFGQEIAADKTERSYRFLEEALELVQAAGCSREDALRLVDYVFGRPVGELHQEVGGVMVTLAAFCSAHARDMDADGETELSRVHSKIEQIREKQKRKPHGSPLPGYSPP
jgi:NTP pyrophosphatase (non-canonical NTP hydrolase)